jgi:hypothetical protein
MRPLLTASLKQMTFDFSPMPLTMVSFANVKASNSRITAPRVAVLLEGLLELEKQL